MYDLTRFQVQEREKDRTIKEREIEAKETKNALKAKELAQKQWETQQKRLESLQASIEALNSENRQLSHQIHQGKHDAAALQYFQGAMSDLDKLIQKKQTELEKEAASLSSLGTPQRNNRTPDSAV